MQQDDFSAESRRLELEKARLECQKIEAEIEQVRLQWWKRPGYIGGLVPIVITFIGFISAVASGYFDTQRDLLQSQVDSLGIEKKSIEEETERLQSRQDDLRVQNQVLVAESERLQEKIDAVYIDLRLGAANLDYAVGHLGACKPDIDPEVLDGLSRRDSSTLDAPAKSVVAELVVCYGIVQMLVGFIGDDFTEYQQNLADIPASDWVKELEPQIGSNKILISPNRKIYHPGTSRFYDSVDELERALGDETGDN